jgi:glyoxylase-like metal-dependent hydrolase (beta-lactamase superfamily II)
MQQLTRHVEIDIERRGSNHGLVTTSDGLVLIDGPHKPSDTLRLKAEIERRGLPLRYILNTEPHGDHWASNAAIYASRARSSRSGSTTSGAASTKG